jgi:hypothetical protein
MFLGGGAYPLPITLAFIGFLAVLSMREAGARKRLAGFGVVIVLMLGLGAAKFFPSIGFLQEFPRAIDEPSGLSVQSLTFGLFSHDQRLDVYNSRVDDSHIDSPDRLLKGISSDFDDVGMYIGPLVAFLALGGLIVSGRSLWKLAAAIPVFVWLSLGDRPGLSLFRLLHRFPVFDAFRYPERFRFVWLLALLIFAGCGLSWLRRRIASRYGERAGLVAALALVTLMTADLLSVTWPINAMAFPIPPMDPIRFSEFRQSLDMPSYNAEGFTRNRFETYGSWSGHYPALLMNIGVINCYETAIVPRRALAMGSPGYRGEVHLDGGEGTVTTESWSPNHLRFRVDVKSAATLVVNQNWYPNWRAEDGRPVTSKGGLVSVSVQPEDTTIELRYSRRSFLVGLIVSAISWIAVGAFLIRARRIR